MGWPLQAQPGSNPRRKAVLARLLVAGVTIILVVGLLAALFATFARGRNDTRVVATPTPVPLASWSIAPHLGNEPVLPIIAPGDPLLVYEAAVTALNGEHVFRRSDDAGATWYDLAVPVDCLSGYALGHLEIRVDRANSQNVIATLSRSLPEQNLQDCPTQRATAAFARQGAATANTPTSAPGNCHLQYFSADGGELWTAMCFPIPGSISPGGVLSDQERQSQGISLFTAIHYHGQDILARIFVSQDHGATWNLADTGRYAPDRTICEFLAAPDSSTLYATTDTPECSSKSTQPVTLWRSDDAGAHWNRLGQRPGPARQLIGVFKSPDHGDVTLHTAESDTERGPGNRHACKYVPE